jgi:hypothetical protein
MEFIVIVTKLHSESNLSPRSVSKKQPLRLISLMLGILSLIISMELSVMALSSK